MADGQMRTIGISERLKNAALTRVFKNIQSLLVVENGMNMCNLFFNHFKACSKASPGKLIWFSEGFQLMHFEDALKLIFDVAVCSLVLAGESYCSSDFFSPHPHAETSSGLINSPYHPETFLFSLRLSHFPSRFLLTVVLTTQMLAAEALQVKSVPSAYRNQAAVLNPPLLLGSCFEFPPLLLVSSSLHHFT